VQIGGLTRFQVVLLAKALSRSRAAGELGPLGCEACTNPR